MLTLYRNIIKPTCVQGRPSLKIEGVFILLFCGILKFEKILIKQHCRIKATITFMAYIV